MAAVVAVVVAAPGSAHAADKAQQQIMAELRMLQEQQQQLQQVLRGLTDTLKTLATRIDEQAGTSRKAFADQKLLVDGVAEGVRILREKSDDTNVRLSSMTQELEAMRQTIASMPVPSAVVPPGDPSTVPPTGTGAAPGTAPAQPTAPPPSTPPVSVSHQRVYDLSYADYAGGQYDLAITGFEQYIRSYPTSPLADDAQLNIGNSYYGAGKYKEAVDALQRVIANYPQGDTLPTAYYKLGQTYERLNQVELARKAYQTFLEKFPSGAFEEQLVRQALERLNRKE
jgi:tol-pal system protein YbgF